MGEPKIDPFLQEVERTIKRNQGPLSLPEAETRLKDWRSYLINLREYPGLFRSWNSRRMERYAARLKEREENGDDDSGEPDPWDNDPTFLGMDDEQIGALTRDSAQGRLCPVCGRAVHSSPLSRGQCVREFLSEAESVIRTALVKPGPAGEMRVLKERTYPDAQFPQDRAGESIGGKPTAPPDDEPLSDIQRVSVEGQNRGEREKARERELELLREKREDEAEKREDHAKLFEKARSAFAPLNHIRDLLMPKPQLVAPSPYDQTIREVVDRIWNHDTAAARADHKEDVNMGSVAFNPYSTEETFEKAQAPRPSPESREATAKVIGSGGGVPSMNQEILAVPRVRREEVSNINRVVTPNHPVTTGGQASFEGKLPAPEA